MEAAGGVGEGGIDLGPAWSWPAYQRRIVAMLDQLGLTAIPQFEDGDFLYETPGRTQQG